MRCLILCLFSVLLLFFTGCETAWGGSPEKSQAKLKAQQTAQVNEQEQQGQLTSQEANEELQSINNRTKLNEEAWNDTMNASPNPAGETFQAPK